MKTLSNIKIGKKLGLLVGATAFQLVCLTCAGWWGIRAADRAMEDAYQEGRRRSLALTISSDQNAVAAQVSNIVMDRRASD